MTDPCELRGCDMARTKVTGPCLSGQRSFISRVYVIVLLLCAASLPCPHLRWRLVRCADPGPSRCSCVPPRQEWVDHTLLSEGRGSVVWLTPSACCQRLVWALTTSEDNGGCCTRALPFSRHWTRSLRFLGSGERLRSLRIEQFKVMTC